MRRAGRRRRRRGTDSASQDGIGSVSVKGTAEVPGGDGKVVNLACDGPRAWLSYAW
jgi:hypothetical protein